MVNFVTRLESGESLIMNEQHTKDLRLFVLDLDIKKMTNTFSAAVQEYLD